MRIFITGADGQLAKSVSEVYPKGALFLATRDNLDVTNRDDVFKKISEYSPDIVFHFASMTRGDECAQNPDEAFRINVGGTENVVNVCEEIGVGLLFVSTNEVFDGKKSSPYEEDDAPNPITVAGKTKYEAEKIIMKKLKKYFIVRTAWLYNKWSHNFLHTVFEKAKKEGGVSLVEDEISSPTCSSDLSESIKKLVAAKKYGLYHLINEGEASRLAFAKKAFDVRGVKTKVTPVKLSDFKRLSVPPLYSPLENIKAREIGISLPKWEDALEKFLINNPQCLV